MIETAGKLRAEYGINRAAQDASAGQSHLCAVAAQVSESSPRKSFRSPSRSAGAPRS